MALGLIQPLTEMSTRSIYTGGKGGRCVGLPTLSNLCADCLEMWEFQPPGTLRDCPGPKWDCFLQPLTKRVLEKCDLVFPLSVYHTVSFLQGHSAAAYNFFFVFPSLLPFPLSFLP